MTSQTSGLDHVADELRRRFLSPETPVMVHSIDGDGRITSVNSQWLKTLEYSRDDVIGRPATQFLTKDSRDYAENVCLRNFFETGIIHGEELQFQSRHGEPIDVLLSAAAERDSNERITGSITVSVDIRYQKRIERLLEHARGRVQHYQEYIEDLVAQSTAAKRRYEPDAAMELQNQLTRSLDAAKRKLGRIRQLAENSSVIERIARIESFLDNAVEESRTITFGLDLSVPQELNLRASVDWLSKQFLERFGLRVTVDDRASHNRVSVLTRDLLIDGVQELLMNVVKRADVERAVVTLETDQELCRIVVQDCGTGFDNFVSRARSGDAEVELSGLVKKLEHYGGHLAVNSTSGQGMRVTMSVPLRS